MFICTQDKALVTADDKSSYGASASPSGKTVSSTKPVEHKKKTKLNQSCVFFGYNIPDDVTKDDIKSFLEDCVESIVSIDIIHSRWCGCHAKIVFRTPSSAHAAITQYDGMYWEDFDVSVSLKLWKDTSMHQTKQHQATVKGAVQEVKSKNTVDKSSLHATNLVSKSRKPVHQVEVHKIKEPARQSHYYSSGSQSYTIKLSGLSFSIKEREIEKLVKPFGDVANVKILRYPENGICYAYVNYCQKSSAEQAVLTLDKREFDGRKIHVCHKGELGVDHSCRLELKDLNNSKSSASLLSVNASETVTTLSNSPQQSGSHDNITISPSNSEVTKRLDSEYSTQHKLQDIPNTIAESPMTKAAGSGVKMISTDLVLSTSTPIPMIKEVKIVASGKKRIMSSTSTQ